MRFEIVGEIEQAETIASGHGLKVRSLGPTMKPSTKQFALCLDNTGNEASLILGKVYQVVPDARGAKDELVRVVDESGEDYLFHKSQFAFVDFPQAVRKKILALQEAS